MQLLNASAVTNISRLAYNPALCLPHLTVSSFDKIPLPIEIPGHTPEIKGIVLDKDNCFAKDHDDKVWPAYAEAWERLRQFYPKEKLLIVSNSAGTNDDVDYRQADKLERDTGVTVLRHPTKKPGCHQEILEYFAQHGINNASEIAVIGDRLFTDILMANMMGAWGVWLNEGVELSDKIFPRMERLLYAKLVTSREEPFMPSIPKDSA
ncbi:HAD-superfamily phosphatase [Metschnikowia bicuspidata var. bicuspidata NRRL YB-4993]|uniref:HAD-superfamily phosphatase n=1 Tax=Metschnikowia bicuspidata var. bicuspidata NRRL YB-4993 TaxID=869754 RepID=A0A1A0HB76_9ASCO|nr:HAD-superfamily phosphatase [Metschnikowia bicuspidata var. bicuspidata NRRL YB-4993]OBA21240.1 HAD-superfamily phosphatase [Metschnikowia bicuspidata var. bicuspidata NRRL YB-4993]